jgi:putative NADPH-quinone reductase
LIRRQGKNVAIDAKRIALVIGHPDPRGGHYCHALAAAFIDGAREAGREVRVITVTDIPDLTDKDEFESPATSPVVISAQETLTWAQHVVVIFPLWLGMMPAKLKSFFEQTFRPSFAFVFGKNSIPKRLLKGRSARIVVTMGMPAFAYRWYFGAHGTRALRRSVLRFCGFGPVLETRIGNVESPTPDARNRWLGRLREFGFHGG